MGVCDQKTTEEILDFFYESGGNFIDTANNYQKEESEMWIGEWMKKRGNRDQMVIATKFTTCFRAGHGDKEILINTTGNGAKSLHISLEASLKKLQTSYIDLLYVHWWDFTCSIPELMQSLNHLVASGKASMMTEVDEMSPDSSSRLYISASQILQPILFLEPTNMRVKTASVNSPCTK
jgi:aryl-alcohol dehydrogenase-like predicted oxidoreductase